MSTCTFGRGATVCLGEGVGLGVCAGCTALLAGEGLAEGVVVAVRRGLASCVRALPDRLAKRSKTPIMLAKSRAGRVRVLSEDLLFLSIIKFRCSMSDVCF